MTTIIIMTGLAVIAVAVVHALAMRASLREELFVRKQLDELEEALRRY